MALILIVEDDRGIRDLLQEILHSAGHQTVHAGDGRVALALARKYRPDLILMDLKLPVLDGISASRLLKADVKTSDIVIIAMSAEPRMLQAVQQCQIDRTLAKPFDMVEFLDVVDSYLEPTSP